MTATGTTGGSTSGVALADGPVAADGRTGDAVFEVTGLTVRFGGVTAVDGVTFSLDRGQILGIIGPNGAGKTTLFDAISGFVPSQGRVVLAGREIGGMVPEGRARHRLGRSFQDARLFPSLTVAEALAVSYERHVRSQGVVSTALRLPWVRRSEKNVSRKVDDLIAMMGLGAFRDKFVAELSTGSRRIVDLALLLAHDPLVLLLDEPSSGIAQRETEALGPLLLRIRDETGAALLVIEHDMPLIRSISDRMMALEMGAIVTVGSPDEVLDDPRVVAAYLGTDQALVQRSGQGAGAGAAPERGKAAAGKARARAGAPRTAARAARTRSADTGTKATGTKATGAKTGRATTGRATTTGAKTGRARSGADAAGTGTRGRAPAARTARSRTDSAPSDGEEPVVVDLTGDEPRITPVTDERSSR